MRIQTPFQPLGPEAIMQRLQQFQSMVSSLSGSQGSGGVAGMSGNLPGDAGGFAPFDPKTAGATITADKAPADLKPLIDRAANENGIDPNLLDAVVSVESSYDPNCRSRAGALGLTQLMPANVKELGVSNPFDPAENLDGGARQLAQLIAKYPGHLDIALAAYNAGPGAVAKAGGSIPNYPETQSYVRKVLDLYHAKQAQQ
ncbi:MAG TPA: lytic transglycosylase domain-containing protein [Fimbriimonadaceae bacterium]|nr:lytic transglycosylase domain-containing protein [Fimbriimonadaceae bacterium]